MDHLRRSSLNYFAAHGLDRASSRRADHGWILERLADPRTRLVPVWRARDLLAGHDAPVPVLLAPDGLGEPETLAQHTVLLGEHEGCALFALDLRLARRVSIAYRLIQDWSGAGHLGPLESRV